MLRRPPTTLQITPEDVAAYEDRRAGEALLAAQQARAAEAAARNAAGGGGGAGVGAHAQAMEGVQASPDVEVRARKVRDDRIGVTRRGR
ncbi:hypothetical protein PT974_05950 [Cladobotryum mycophilum]|uniref:Anaphase-promoting complex, subunit CDC26 n=1 Tax=Cladobotryum mycophilum TaxID=491253 RepID=A0ABR0SKG1_9HYPO